MSGFPVTIVDSGGMPVTFVETGAPPVSVVDSGGIPVTVVESGGTPLAAHGAYGGGFDPATLFAAGEQGAWYDPSDLSTMYQDSAGTTPSAIGAPDGLVLDKRFGLERGPDIPLTSNNASVTYVDGVATFTAASTAQGLSNLFGPLTLGRFYEIKFRVVSISSGAVRPYVGTGTLGLSATTPGFYSTILPSSGSDDPSIIAIGTTTAVVDQISYREIPGNHATQSTTARRPALNADRINYDGVDDYLRTVFPNLGSDVTIARAIPSVGASILTGQTIGAGNWDDSTDHNGLLIINRSLTANETTQLAAWMDGKAGV